MNYQDLEAAIQRTMSRTPKLPDESKAEYERRIHEMTMDKLNKYGSLPEAQERTCQYCEQPIKSGGLHVELGDGVYVHAHKRCYDTAIAHNHGTSYLQTEATAALGKALIPALLRHGAINK